MRKLFTFFGLFALGSFGFTAKAQNNFEGNVKGTVSGNQTVLESATVNLLKAGDSSIVKQSFTDKTGAFEINQLKDGSYIIKIQSVGYQPYFSDLQLTENKRVFELGKITLVSSAKLKDVTVTSKKALIEQKIDRTVVNVDAAPTNTGLTALELLEKSPGVSVDKDGNISLKGKPGVLVLIDGKPTYLSGTDLATMLKSMPGSNLDQIEIMTNPPAKYDAAGNSGIINLKTKKSKIKGFNGSVAVGGGMGINPKANESVNLNYRTGKVNLFGNYSYNYNEGFQSLYLTRKFKDSATNNINSIFEQNSRMSPKYQNHNYKFGIDYYATAKTTLGVVINGYVNPGTFSSTNTTDIYDAQHLLQSQTQASSMSKEKWNNIGTNFNLRHSFDSTGKEISLDADYIHYNSFSNQLFNNYFFNASGGKIAEDETLRGSLPGDINIYSVKSDFTLPLKKNAKFEAGVKSSYVETDNNAIYDNYIDGEWVNNAGRTNHFVYKENVNAAYVNLSKQLSKKWSVQTGLRAENTIAKGNQLTTGETFNRNYTQLFPTAYVAYNANEKNTFSLNYGRRIQRPDYGDLNPFYYFLDKYTYQVGNPYLKPQFSHNIELSHSYKGFLNTTLNYTAVNDLIEQVLEQVDSTHTTYVKQSNIANQRSVGLSVSAGFPITKWWSTNIYAQGSYNRYSGYINNGFIEVEGGSFMANMSNQFKLKDGWSMELSGFFRSRSVEGVMIALPMGKLDFAVAKNVWKNKGTIKLNFRDFLDVQQFRGYSQYQNIDVRIKNQWDNRVVNLSFTYRFNKGKVTPQQEKRGGGADDEQNRVKGGRG